MTTLPRNLSESEVSIRLGLSTRTLQAWRRRGQGPQYVKLGRSVRYPETAIAEYERAHLHQSTAEYPAAGARSPSPTPTGRTLPRPVPILDADDAA